MNIPFSSNYTYKISPLQKVFCLRSRCYTHMLIYGSHKI
uniref:Uncharacterized protein n=1 Tax=Rhizophora mucronata TaxID=61149 RepID=A0A2P2P3I4_RHIMU